MKQCGRCGLTLEPGRKECPKCGGYPVPIGKVAFQGSQDACWISPQGQIFPCTVAKHLELADQLAKERGMVGDGEQALEAAGWVKMTGWLWHSTKVPRQPQIDAIWSFCQEKGRSEQVPGILRTLGVSA